MSNDYSNDFAKIRGSIVDKAGTKLSDVVKTLRPKYFAVYRDIAFGIIMIAIGCALPIFANGNNFGVAFLILCGAIWFGYWFAYLQLFIHEGAHWNLAPGRWFNDFISNLFAAWWVGQDISDYRRVHFQHHRALGTDQDTEPTYFHELNSKFLLEAATGALAAKTMLKRKHWSALEPASLKERTLRQKLALPIGLLLHISVLLIFAFQELYSAIAVWVLGMGAFFPFFGALRQLLEHRPLEGDSVGAVTRMFTGPLSNSFGGAGFKQHLLHHWEPNISYTRLPELEQYLLDTSAGPIIQNCRTTYFATFRSLYK